MEIMLAFSAMVAMATAYPYYQNSIPNGGSVPDPCNPGATWLGVGHMIPQGTGARNYFGLEFGAAGHQWTVELCQKDSDGDSLTNGQELGDPDCLWTPDPSNNVTLSPATSHPGICEPIGTSGACEQHGFACP